MRKSIRELKDKDHFHSAFVATGKTVGRDRNGKSFMSLTLGDTSGRINARMFDKVDESAQSFADGDVVMVKGFVQLFQNRKQIIVNEIRKAVDGEFEMKDMVSQQGGDPRKHLQELLGIVSGLQDEHIRRLLLETLSDKKLEDILLKAPAAKTIHHAYRGGLLEHIRSIVAVMESLAGHYPFLNRDLLIFGAIYHDIGKIFELELTDGIHYTPSGKLVGHMVLACDMVEQKAALIQDFPAETKDVLKHIILSHHGKLEYGSPKLPMLPEAMVVAMIDDLDSKLNTLYHFLKMDSENAAPGEKWSSYHSGFERYFYMGFFKP